MDSQIKQILEWSGEPSRALHDFEQFTRNYQKKAGQAFDLEPVNAKRLLSLFGNSHFLSLFLLKHPLEADSIVNSPALESDKKIENYREDLAELFVDLTQLSSLEFGKKIRHYKYQEYLRLTVKDLSEAAGMESLLAEISDLAIAIIETCYQYFYLQLSRENGTPKTLDKNAHPCRFSVIAQGKLGGRELNYSSDVDLQFVYETDKAKIEKSDLSPHEFFIKLSEKLSRFISDKTEDGFLYRVDMNLRPEGKHGPLANSMAGLEHYYESFGEEWERQALIKALPIVGDPKLGKQFLNLIAPFVWRKSFDLASIEKLKQIKARIHNDSKKGPPRGFNVKLGAGGIREVEYFVQILQLLYGGKNPSLRCHSTLEALQELVKLNLLTPREAHPLKDAYLFLRKIEHRLQTVNEAQTHNLPTSPPDQEALARRMGYYEEDLNEARQRFLDDLSHATSLIQSNFQNLFEEKVL